MEQREKALLLKSKFGATAIDVCKEIIDSSPSLPVLGDGGTFGEDIELSTKWWKGVLDILKNEYPELLQIQT